MVRGHDGDFHDDDGSSPDPYDWSDPDALASWADWERKDRRENPEMYPAPNPSS